MPIEVRKTAAPDSKPPEKRHVFRGGTTTIFQKTLLGLRGRGGSKSAPVYKCTVLDRVIDLLKSRKIRKNEIFLGDFFLALQFCAPEHGVIGCIKSSFLRTFNMQKMKFFWGTFFSRCSFAHLNMV